ncbi:MAG: hypothetical protein WCL11_17945, partial [Verrucomicrobiota bacterium]
GRTWDMQETSPVNEDPLAEDNYSRDEQIVLTPLRQADPAAAEVQREQQSFHEMFGQPLLALQAVVLASTEAAARVVGSTLAEAGFIDGSYGLCVHAHRPTRRGISKALQGIRLIEPQTMVPLRDQADLSELSPLFQLLHVASVEELSGLFRFPVASSSSPCCFRKNTDPPETLSAGAHLQMGWDATVSGIGGKVERGIELNALCRHLFLCGTPGSGKTTAALNLLIQLGRHRVPSLVLEPVKTEFRSLKRLANDPCPEVAEWAKALEIYTPGNEDLMPLRLNPLELLPGVTPSEHIDALEACFKAAMPLSGPLPGILREGLEEVYDMAGPGQPSPTVPSLLAATERALLRKRYSGATYADLRGALDTRLGCLTWGGIGRVFRCTSSLPAMLRLLTTPTIIELDKLSREQACLLTLFLMVRLRQALRTLPRAGGSLRLVLVIDEAHNLVGPDTSAEPSEDNADPKAYASEFVCRMLAEMRAQGVGIIICDQTPSAVAAEVIKHPATKLAFQQCHEADRAAIGAAMLFQATEYEDIARLRPGEAYFFANGYYGPRKIRTVNLHDQIDLSPVADEELKQIIHGEAWFAETTRTRLESGLQSLKAAMDDFDETRLRCVSAAIRLCARLPRALGLSDPSLRRQAVAAVRRDAAALKHRLGEAHRQFRIREYSPLLPSVETTLAAGTALTQRRAVLVARYEKVMRPDTNQCLAILEGLIHNKTKTIK